MARNEEFDNLCARVADQTDLSNERAIGLVETVFEQLGQSLRKGDDVSIPNFGTFRRVHQGEREYKNPQTGKDVHVPDRQKVLFEPTGELEKAVKTIEGKPR